MNIEFSDRIKDIDSQKGETNDYIKEDLLSFKRELVKENTNSKLQEMTLEQSIFQLWQIDLEIWKDWKFSKKETKHPNAVKIIFLIQRIFAWTEFDCWIIDWVRWEKTAIQIKKFNNKYIWKWNWVLWPKIVAKIIEIFKDKKEEKKLEQQTIEEESQWEWVSVDNSQSEKTTLSFEKKYKDIIKKYPWMSRLFNAMKKTNFLPEQEVIEYFLKMWIQESSLSWSPKMDYSKSWNEWRKKQEIKKAIESIIKNTNSIFGILLSTLLEQEENNQISDFVSKLNLLYLDKNATEYDLYLITQEISKFFKEFKLNHQTLLNLSPSEYIEKFNKEEKEINHIPSSFWIWQINVDLFLEKIKKNNIISKFPELLQLTEEEQRRELVKALCWESSILNRDRTMELIIEWHLKPRYLNHNKWEANDLKYMVVENLTWEMSTYYSSIQKKLNEDLVINPAIKVDWIIYVRQKYSNEIDWGKTKNYWTTYKALVDYIKKSKNTEMIKNKEKLIKELFEADSFEKLSNSILYKDIMWEKAWERYISPDMKSSNQTAEEYFEMIKKK